MSTDNVENNDINGSFFFWQGPSFSRYSQQGNIGRHPANLVNIIEREESGLAKRIRKSIK